MSSFSPLPLDWLPRSQMHLFINIPLEFQPWIYSVFGALLIGIAGVFPLAFIPLDYGLKRNNKPNDSFNILQLVLSFAVGGLLSDVFLHLLPEAWTIAIEGGSTPQEAFSNVGLCVLCGIFIFIIVEMLAANDSISSSPPIENNNTKISPYISMKPSENEKIKVIGYLNLIANGIDNFAHGLAVAGSFLVSYRTGVLTTTAILIHEVPHEIGDFAILLNSGFTRWEAAKAQLYTASIGLIGALFTLFMGTSQIIGGLQVYILGFTAGGFLNIALVSVLPDLLKEDRPSHSAVQLLSLVLGVGTMAAVSYIC